MRLTLIRHGDAHAGFHGPISGPVGCRGLTDLGRQQAGLLRERLSSDDLSDRIIVVSELPRAIETAELAIRGSAAPTPTRDCDLCELHTGEADGTPWEDYGENFGSFDMMQEPDRPFAPGGDSWNGFHERVTSFMHRTVRDHAGQEVLAFTSAGVIAASLRIHFGNARADFPRLTPMNTSLTVWTHDPSHGWTLVTYNDDQHLQAPTTSR